MAKVKVPKEKKFSGVLYGVKFIDGVSEEIKNKHLVERLVHRGYEVVKKEAKEENEEKK